MNTLFPYGIYLKSMNISPYGFVCQVNFLYEKYIRVKKKKFLYILLRKNSYQVFMNYSRILPIWWILFLFLFASFGIHKLFLFLFIQKFAPRIYSYSYSLEKLLFPDHCQRIFLGVWGITALNWLEYCSSGSVFLHRIYITTIYRALLSQDGES